jgi:Flp pilus assembly protein TadG
MNSTQFKKLIKKGEKGQSLTEVAVSFVLLMIILAVAIDGGRVFSSFIAVRDAAEEGALFGAYNPTDSSGIESRVRTTSSNPINLSDTGLVSVSSNVFGSPCTGNSIQVSVTYTFNLTMPFIGAVLGTQTFPLTANSIATILSPSC